MRKYLGVRAVHKKGIVQHWSAHMHGKELGQGRSPEAAAEIVRRMAGAKSIEELVIPASVPCPRSVARYEGVFWRAPGAKSSGGWWVDKKVFFKSQRAAVAFAAKQRGVTPEALRKPVAPRELCARIAALCPVLDAMPWDIKDLVDRAPAAAGMFRKVPVLTVLFVQAKLGPWRALMQQAWQAIMSDVHCRKLPLSEAAEAELAYAVLVRAVKGMAKSHSLRSHLCFWNELNLGTQHHSGFVAMCGGLDVIATGGHLDLGSADSMYKLVDDSARALGKLKKMSASWSALSSVLCVPKTCNQWRQCMLDCMKVLAERACACCRRKPWMLTTPSGCPPSNV